MPISVNSISGLGAFATSIAAARGHVTVVKAETVTGAAANALVMASAFGLGIAQAPPGGPAPHVDLLVSGVTAGGSIGVTSIFSLSAKSPTSIFSAAAVQASALDFSDGFSPLNTPTWL